MMINFSELIGKTFVKIEGAESGSELVVLTDADGCSYRMQHDQDCCENVCLEDVCGDVADLIGSPILQAEESSNDKEHPEGWKVNPEPYVDYSFTWTFYRIATIKGSIVFRWLGTSNGYYSESVNVYKDDPVIA